MGWVRSGRSFTRGDPEPESRLAATIPCARCSLSALAIKTCTATRAYAQLWSLLGRQLTAPLRADTEAVHEVGRNAMPAW